MEDFPPLPDVDDAPAAVESGHLWLLERVDGYPLRFTVADGGWLGFGGPDGEFGAAPPPQYRPAIRHVRDTIDRDALADVPDGTVVSGVATSHRRIDYDWERLPPFLGLDVRSGDDLLAPDAAERALRGLDLTPVNAVEKEVAARHFSPSSYDVPGSAWYDGPPPGIVIRNKAGGRALLSTAGFEPPPPEAPEGDPAEVARRLATPARIEAAIEALEGEGRDADFDAVRQRATERIVREGWGRIVAPERPIDPDDAIAAIETAIREYLVAERPGIVDGE